jgi:hypothetical protein
VVRFQRCLRGAPATRGWSGTLRRRASGGGDGWSGLRPGRRGSPMIIAMSNAFVGSDNDPRSEGPVKEARNGLPDTRTARASANEALLEAFRHNVWAARQLLTFGTGDHRGQRCQRGPRRRLRPTGAPSRKRSPGADLRHPDGLGHPAPDVQAWAYAWATGRLWERTTND